MHTPKLRDWLAYLVVFIAVLFLILGKLILYIAEKIGGPFTAEKIKDLGI
jgi:hypothetical protein